MADLAAVVARERAELARRVGVYRGPGHGPRPGAHRGLPIVVDDGLATGVTARAALRASPTGGRPGAGTVLAVPVAAQSSLEAINAEADEVVTVVTARRLRSVGEWYVDFGQLTDADVLTLLAEGQPWKRESLRPRWRDASGDGARPSARPRSGHPRCRTSQDGPRRS